MLQANSTNRITFTVGVHGTAAVPSVKCLLGSDPALTFPAVHLNDDQWEVKVKLPADFPAGVYPFKLEVHLNGRVFTPINRELTVLGVTPSMEQEPIEIPQIAVPQETPPEPEDIVTLEPIQVPKKAPEPLRMSMLDVAREADLKESMKKTSVKVDMRSIAKEATKRDSIFVSTAAGHTF